MDDPWNGDAVRLRAFQDTACTVGDVMAKLEANASSDQVDAKEVTTTTTTTITTVTNASKSIREETDDFCAQLRRALDRVRAYEEATAVTNASKCIREDPYDLVAQLRRAMVQDFAYKEATAVTNASICIRDDPYDLVAQLRRAMVQDLLYKEATPVTDAPAAAAASASAADAQMRDDEGPVEPRRRRRTRAPRRRSASPVLSTSSSDSSVDRPITHRPILRSQHDLSHARADRLHRLRMRPGKVDSALAKRQRSLDRDANKPPEQPKVSNEAMETHVRRHAYSLDGNPGWTLPLPRRPSHGEFVVKTYNTFSADDDDIPAPAVNWETLRMAREKCTEWLVKHVLLPDPSPRNRNSKPRVA